MKYDAPIIESTNVTPAEPYADTDSFLYFKGSESDCLIFLFILNNNMYRNVIIPAIMMTD